MFVALTLLAACGLPIPSEDDGGSASSGPTEPPDATSTGPGATSTGDGPADSSGAPSSSTGPTSCSSSTSSSEGSEGSSTTGECLDVGVPCIVDPETQHCGCWQEDGTFAANLDPRMCGCHFEVLGPGLQCYCDGGCDCVPDQGPCGPFYEETCEPSVPTVPCGVVDGQCECDGVDADPALCGCVFTPPLCLCGEDCDGEPDACEAWPFETCE